MSKPYMRQLPRAWRTSARVFTALGDEHRQRILLMFEGARELTIKDIVAASPLSQTAVMYHLRVLRDAKVLLATKEGRSVHLRPNLPVVREAMQRVLDYMHEEFGSESEVIGSSFQERKSSEKT
jgi:ArsR family transcriptional regulator